MAPEPPRGFGCNLDTLIAPGIRSCVIVVDRVRLLTLLVAALCDVEVCAQSLADDFACGFVVVCCAPFGCCTQFRVEADCQDFRWA